MANVKIELPVGIVALSADPTIEPAGSVFYNTTELSLKVSNGSTWSAVGSADRGGTTYVGVAGLTLADHSIYLMSNQLVIDGQLILQGDSILTHN